MRELVSRYPLRDAPRLSSCGRTGALEPGGELVGALDQDAEEDVDGIDADLPLGDRDVVRDLLGQFVGLDRLEVMRRARGTHQLLRVDALGTAQVQVDNGLVLD